LMMARYDALVQKVELLKHKANGKRLEKWLTGHEVCQLLRISPRTLQKLRDRRFLGHTQFGRQFYYKPEEVKALIPLISRIKTTK
jgi:excisionase family DNA binding protein